jgi:metal-responsive CopG/Arc/MetJ family transcriptional regulator
MTAFKKVAVSVPADTFAALERARGKLGKSRSEVVAAAIKDWLRGLEAGAVRERYIAGYLQLPESADDLQSTLQMAAAATADWSAWEPGAPSHASEARGRTKR